MKINRTKTMKNFMHEYRNILNAYAKREALNMLGNGMSASQEEEYEKLDDYVCDAIEDDSYDDSLPEFKIEESIASLVSYKEEDPIFTVAKATDYQHLVAIDLIDEAATIKNLELVKTFLDGADKDAIDKVIKAVLAGQNKNIPALLGNMYASCLVQFQP